jgi:hypothetical protein
MRRTLVIACLLLSACHRVSDAAKDFPPPASYVHTSDKVAAQMLRWGILWRLPCKNVERDDQCFKFTKPQRMQGLWRNDFEGSLFCELGTQCSNRQSDGKRPRAVWLEMKARLSGRKDTPPGGLYAIDFIGRRSEYRGMFGHMGMWDGEVIVDRLISIEELEPPPPQPTKAEVIADAKKCEAEGSCIPNWEMINSIEE